MDYKILGFIVGAIIGTLAGLYLGAHFFPESSQGVGEQGARESSMTIFEMPEEQR